MATPLPSSPHDRAELYRSRALEFEKRAELFGARSKFYSNLRGLSFGVFAIAGVFALLGRNLAVSGPLTALAGVCFVALIALHARIIAQEDEALRWARVNRDGEARCSGRWRDLPEDGSRFASMPHPYAGDLDLFGHASLFQRVSVAHTRFGQNALAEYLRNPAEPGEVQRRQAAVRALAAELELRQRLEALSFAVLEPQSPQRKDKPREPPDPEPLLAWAESAPMLATRGWLVIVARVLPVFTVLALAFGSALGLGPWIWATPLLVQVFLNFYTRDATSSVFAAVSSTEGAFLRYGGMLELLENLQPKAELLEEMKERVNSAGVRPSAAMSEFRRKVGWFDLKHNGLIHPAVNTLLLWDIQCVLALEAWQRRAGGKTRVWFSTLGELEALSSLAGLAHDEPEFVFPEVVGAPLTFVASGLGHPLIDAPSRVPNDVSLPAPGTALLVTGSNMSGKSTLLRAMGLSAVMAMAGAPVCARQLKLARCAVRTSIRVSDSLESGVSHFYAEISKLKAVVDATAEGQPVLFLLDEILHGTNSRERQIGARWVMSELLQRGAIGAVSTHDMELCRLDEPLMSRVTLVHFRENVENGRMTFDYKVRPGAVTAGNALRLMQLIGLDVPLE
ncbi:MAG TPA: DNA mismatch repair protein MutS [Polyangiaceae bacterium]|nr:DNA mismatch repair protein MutS [Polyangiaceae bacterium]